MSDYVAGKAWKQEKYDRILEAGYTLFSERGIDLVTMTEVADASGVGRMTAFRYFPSKTELVIAIYIWKWKEYITWHNSLRTPEEIAKHTGAERLKMYIDSFLKLYRNHKDMLRFNYTERKACNRCKHIKSKSFQESLHCHLYGGKCTDMELVC